METTPTPEVPPPSPAGVPAPMTNRDERARSRRISWLALMVLLVMPAVWLGSAVATSVVLRQLGNFGLYRFEHAIMMIVPVLVAVVATASLAWFGLRRRWHSRKVLMTGWSITALLVVVAVVFVVPRLLEASQSSVERQVQGNLWRISSTLDQFALETGLSPYRIFIARDEFVGPQLHLRTLNSVRGEDYDSVFPLRQDRASTLTVTLPDGRESQRTEVLAVTMPNGRVVTYPEADDAAGRKQDGVHTLKWTDGRYYKITYRGGVPDGPFRAYFADGALWGEATYARGRIVGPSWLYGRDGRKFDELADPASAAAVVGSSVGAAAKELAAAGARKLRARDFAGAIEDLTRALVFDPANTGLSFSLAEAKKGSGDLDGAIAEYHKQAGIPLDGGLSPDLPADLLNAYLARGRQRRANNNPSGAAEDFRRVTRTLAWKAENDIRNRLFQDAIKDLTTAIEVAPTAELHQMRGKSRYELRDLAGAETDYTSAIELAEQGVMQIPGNKLEIPVYVRYERAHVRRLLGNRAAAAEDFRAVQPRLGLGNVISREDAAFWLFLVQCEQGRKEAAIAELARTDQSGWWKSARQCAQFLLGKMTEAQFEKAMAEGGETNALFRAAFYSAMLRRFAGDAAGARDRFSQASRHPTADEFARAETVRALAAEARGR